MLIGRATLGGAEGGCAAADDELARGVCGRWRTTSPCVYPIRALEMLACSAWRLQQRRFTSSTKPRSLPSCARKA